MQVHGEIWLQDDPHKVGIEEEEEEELGRGSSDGVGGGSSCYIQNVAH
jgi:hypothetical protein